MQADYLGQENVSRAIELSKLTKFTISRAGNNGLFTPIFECLDSDSNIIAVEQFNEVAKILNNSIPYKITLFDFAEIDTDENGTQKIKKRGGGRDHKKNTFTFILNSTALNLQANQQQTQHNIGTDFANLRADIIKEISKQQEDNLILKEISELKKKFAELDEEEEDEEDEKTVNGISPDMSQQMAQIMGLINMFKNPNTPPTINGAEETQSNFKENINKALKTLYKHNKNLDTDLLKLGEIAENKPDTFNMLINTLRQM